MSIIDIVFQTGEFYYQNTSKWWTAVLGSILGAVISGGIAIFIFNRGAKRQKEKEIANETKRLAELKKYYCTLLHLIEEPLNQQRIAFIKFAKTLKEKKDQDYGLRMITSFNLENIKKVSHSDLYKIFVDNGKGDIENKTKKFQKLQASIDLLFSINSSYQDAFKDFLKKFEKHQLEWDLNLGIIGNIFDSMMVVAKNYKTRPNDDPFFYGFDKLVFSWTQLEKEGINYKDRNIAYECYVLKLKELCKKYDSDLRIPDLIKFIMNCIYTYNDLEHLKYFYRKYFIESARKLNTARYSINSALQELDME